MSRPDLISMIMCIVICVRDFRLEIRLNVVIQNLSERSLSYLPFYCFVFHNI